MSLSYKTSWEMGSGPAVACEPKSQSKHWVCAEESACRVHQGLCAGMQTTGPVTASIECDLSKNRKPSLSGCLMSADQPVIGTRWECHNLNTAKCAVNGIFANASTGTGNFCSPFRSSLRVVAEDKPWDNSSCMDNDSSQLHEDISSISSSSSMGGDSSCTSDDTSEVQSRFKGPLASMSALEEALPCKRGLSGFYSGKSRSFSCLADITSIKDFAKPESPYAKRRRYISACIRNGDRPPRLHPLRTGACGVSKKAFHNHSSNSSSSKFSMALAVALSAKDEQGSTFGLSIKVAPSRSYSLSDLQGARHPCCKQ